ncbi:MAG: YitT family protein [Synergistaceae bacterium]|nr:YitT family protein [Synergistaceae bacterium]MBQ3347263.1 YitT family protein [Synergistaceae bacterium]MBQ3397263.1 YitT family protein [Synergistaceae bacterium]MBQ3760298.1 YitT family protein [Synergistaceae bacterium]MBQ6417733.1 YitT family protein [Synergistaceae bacterium]
MKNAVRKFFTLAYALITSEWKAVAVIMLASLLQAFAVNYFTLHYKFPDLGVSGIAVLTNYMFGISPNWVILTGNIILLMWAWRDLNLHFLALTIIAILTFSAGLSIFALYPLPLPDDKFMATVIIGLLKGLGGGMMFNAGGSSGGTDIVAAAMRRRYGIEVGRFSIFINMFILALSVGVVGLESVVYGAVGLYVDGVTMDNVTRSFDRRKQAIIITNKPDEVSHFINEHGRGVTRLEGRGGYTGQPRPVLITLLDPRQVVLLKRFLKEHDERAFVSICDAAEVLGQGFKSWRSL